MDFTFDNDNPLTRCKGESKKATQALWDYYHMGTGRSLRKMHEIYNKQRASKEQTDLPPTMRWSTLCGWSFKFAWQARVARQTEIEREEDAALWRERRRQIRERDWEQGGRLRALADAILDEAPKFAKTTRRLVRGQGGEPDREVITIRLDGGLAVKSAKGGSDLQRLGGEMETERKEVSGTIQIEDVNETRQRLLADIEKQLETPDAGAEEGAG